VTKLDAYGRPGCPSTWGGTAMPRPGTYRVKLVRGGLWLPASVACEQLVSPEDARLYDRWAMVLRILQWSWHRWELLEWESSLHPVDPREFELMRARELPCGPLEAYDAGHSRLAI
jgi:hypothetical protein